MIRLHVSHVCIPHKAVMLGTTGRDSIELLLHMQGWRV